MTAEHMGQIDACQSVSVLIPQDGSRLAKRDKQQEAEARTGAEMS
ncbi:MAG: hypothetical protein QF732_11810 [Nitrospinaceae bacterium]|jgi:hypothetical protein|nr:hypothetical protein [Nitrospinaceae bacterium]